MASLSSSPLSSALHPPPKITKKKGADRPSPFHPSVWGDFFLSYNEDDKTKALVRGYFHEALWLNSGYVPTLEEYLKVSVITSGYFYMTAASYVGMGEEATKEVFDWLKTHPKFVMDSCLIGRLVDDIQSHKFEKKRLHVASAVECYMKEYGTSRAEACEKMREMVSSAWKDMNKFCLKPTPLPLSLLMRVINFARVIEVIYLHGDGYTDSSCETKENISAVFVDPIPM